MIKKIDIPKPEKEWEKIKIKLDRTSIIKFGISSIASAFFSAPPLTPLILIFDIIKIKKEPPEAIERIYILLSNVDKYFLNIITSKLDNQNQKTITSVESIFDSLISKSQLYINIKDIQKDKLNIRNIEFYEIYYKKLENLLNITENIFYEVIENLITYEWVRSSIFYNKIRTIIDIPFTNEKEISQEKSKNITESFQYNINKNIEILETYVLDEKQYIQEVDNIDQIIK